MKENSKMPQTERHVRLFRNGRNQAVRIPREFELEGDEAIMIIYWTQTSCPTWFATRKAK
jgi:hypothetical protein